MGVLPDGLLEILQCPKCHSSLREREDPPALICDQCQIAYPVEDGVPVMLEEAAEPVTE